MGVGRFPGITVEPTTFHAPYSPDREMPPVPQPPEPYATHENSEWIMGKWAKE